MFFCRLDLSNLTSYIHGLSGELMIFNSQCPNFS